MFGLGDDFEIDENFLDEVFEVEKACITNASKKNQKSHTSIGIPQEPNLPLTAKTNLEDTRLNILPEQQTGQHSFNLDSTRFVETPQIDLDSPNESPRLNIDSSRLVTTPIPLCSSNVTPVLGTRSVSNNGKSSRKIRTRKFPGPAGLLPERQSNSSLIATDDFLDEIEQELNQENQYKEEVVLSQESASNLESPAWGELLKDLGPEGRNLMKTLNVASVCSRAKQTRALKVPFIALLINNVDASTADPCLYLSDSTGKIVGAVHREVWERLGSDLIVGTVIVLINVGLLCAGNTTSRHYLNITSNNIAALYSPTKESDIRVTNMKSLSKPDCSKFLQTWQHILSTPVQSQQLPETRQLFTTAHLSPSLPLKRPFSKSLDTSFNRTPTLDSPIRSVRNDRFSLDNSPISRPNHRFNSNHYQQSNSNITTQNLNLSKPLPQNRNNLNQFNPNISNGSFNQNSNSVRSQNPNLERIPQNSNTNRIPQNHTNIPQNSNPNSRLPQNTNNIPSNFRARMPQNNQLPQNSVPSLPQSSNLSSCTNFQAKKPKFDVISSSMLEESQCSQVDDPSSLMAASQSIVESELDGIDTESLFDDF